jgi:hypothetical protein
LSKRANLDEPFLKDRACMNTTETRPLPNAADKAALKTIATRIIRACPSLQDTAHEVASNLLKKHAITGLGRPRCHVFNHRHRTDREGVGRCTRPGH